MGSADVGTLVPVKTKPAQIPQNRVFCAGLESRAVQIVNPEQKPPTLKTAMEPGQKRCAQIAQVERPAGGWCKTRPNRQDLGSLLHAVLEHLARTEGGHALCRDLNRLTRLRVQTLTG